MTDANISVSFSASITDFVAGVSEAKDALQSLSEPFDAINKQLASLAKASSQALSAADFQPYRDALTAARSLEQAFAADRARAAQALRSGDDDAYADATKAAQLATAEELRLLADGLKQKLALYAEEARGYEITQSEKLRLSSQAIDEEYAGELAGNRSGSSRLRRSSVWPTWPSRRRDGATTN